MCYFLASFTGDLLTLLENNSTKCSPPYSKTKFGHSTLHKSPGLSEIKLRKKIVGFSENIVPVSREAVVSDQFHVSSGHCKQTRPSYNTLCPNPQYKNIHAILLLPLITWTPFCFKKYAQLYLYVAWDYQVYGFLQFISNSIILMNVKFFSYWRQKWNRKWSALHKPTLPEEVQKPMMLDTK